MLSDLAGAHADARPGARALHVGDRCDACERFASEAEARDGFEVGQLGDCLLYTSPSPRD